MTEFAEQISMSNTGERLESDWYYKDRYTYNFHISRYRFAKAYLNRLDSVIDVACGEGYGTYELASKALRVVGIDRDEQTVAGARSKYKSKGIRFVQGNCTDIAKAVPECKFNAAVSFETLEHLNAADQNRFLAQIVRVLDKEGIFIVSTPNNTNNGATQNPFHLRELTLSDFKSLLHVYFEDVFLFGQRRFEFHFEKNRLFRLSALLGKLWNWRSKRLSTLSNIEIATRCVQGCDVEIGTHYLEECEYLLAVCKIPISS